MEAKEVVHLVERTVRLRLPDELPKEMAARLSPDEQAEYDPSDPMLGFFMPPLLKALDRELYRDVRRFWRLSRRERLALVPGLVEDLIAEARDEVVDGLAQVVFEVLDDSFDVPGYEQALETAVPRILDSDADDETRLYFLHGFHSFLARTTTERARLLVDLAMGRDRDNEKMRCELIWGLTGMRTDLADATIRSFLLERAQADPSLECRVAGARSLPGLFPAETWEPILLNVLDQTLDEAHPPGSQALIRELAFYRQRPSVAPLLMKALGSENPDVRGHAIGGLEKLFRLDGERLGYDSFHATSPWSLPQFYAARSNVLILEAQSMAVNAWRQWWSDNCARLSVGCGATTRDEVGRSSGPDPQG
jgi:hypothetical protein